MEIWDTHISITYTGNVPIDMNSPPLIGDIATLSVGKDHFEIEIKKLIDDTYEGEVKIIDPPAIESQGIRRGDIVAFKKENISILKRV